MEITRVVRPGRFERLLRWLRFKPMTLTVTSTFSFDVGSVLSIQTMETLKIHAVGNGPVLEPITKTVTRYFRVVSVVSNTVLEIRPDRWWLRLLWL